MTVSCQVFSVLSFLPAFLTCPQVFDNTPAALDGTVAAGDEITGVNGRSIKGKTKVEVAKMIQEVKVGLLQEWGPGRPGREIGPVTSPLLTASGSGSHSGLPWAVNSFS